MSKGNDKPRAIASGIPVYCTHDKLVDPASLKPDPKNYNIHDDRQVDMLIVSIREQGWQKPVVVDTRTGYIVTGHGEVSAAIKASLGLVPVDYRYYKNDAVRHRWMIADNQFSRLSEPSLPALKDLISEIDTGEFDISATGFSEKHIEALMTSNAMIPNMDIKQGDIEKSASGVPESKITSASVMCPKCGEEFSIQI